VDASQEKKESPSEDADKIALADWTEADDYKRRFLKERKK